MLRARDDYQRQLAVPVEALRSCRVQALREGHVGHAIDTKPPLRRRALNGLAQHGTACVTPAPKSPNPALLAGSCICAAAATVALAPHGCRTVFHRLRVHAWWGREPKVVQLPRGGRYQGSPIAPVPCSSSDEGCIPRSAVTVMVSHKCVIEQLRRQKRRV